MIIKVEPKKPTRWVCHVCAGEPKGQTWQFETCSDCQATDRVCMAAPHKELDQQQKIL